MDLLLLLRMLLLLLLIRQCDHRPRIPVGQVELFSRELTPLEKLGDVVSCCEALTNAVCQGHRVDGNVALTLRLDVV